LSCHHQKLESLRQEQIHLPELQQKHILLPEAVARSSASPGLLRSFELSPPASHPRLQSCLHHGTTVTSLKNPCPNEWCAGQGIFGKRKPMENELLSQTTREAKAIHDGD